MINLLLSESIYFELKGYLDMQLDEARQNLYYAEEQYNYYKDIEDEKDDAIENVKYYQKQVNKYELALKSFKE